MGKRFREQRNKRLEKSVATSVVVDDLAVNQAVVGTVYREPLVPYQDGYDRLTDIADNWPTQLENFKPGANGVEYNNTPVGSIKDLVDYEIGGQSGLAAFAFPRSTGVVSSDAVEDFTLTGQQAVIRRQPDTNYGPVSTSDHNALLALAFAQSANQFYPNEESQFDVIRSI